MHVCMSTLRAFVTKMLLFSVCNYNTFCDFITKVTLLKFVFKPLDTSEWVEIGEPL